MDDDVSSGISSPLAASRGHNQLVSAVPNLISALSRHLFLREETAVMM
jgi:hypothetical protein